MSQPQYVETEIKELTKSSDSTGTPCSGCGAEIREGSLFCYNCGGSVQLNGSIPNGDPTVQRFPRSRPRPSRHRGPVEVTWRRSDGPGYKLLLVALVAAVLVGLVLVFANYLH